MSETVVIRKSEPVSFQYVRIPRETGIPEIGVVDDGTMAVTQGGRTFHFFKDEYDQSRHRGEAIDIATGEIVTVQFEEGVFG